MDLRTGLCQKNFINIDSPLFEIISKVKDFDNSYTIYR